MLSNLQLKWKIIILTLSILFIILLSLNFIIYNFTTGVVKEEINNQIDIINTSQQKTINNLIKQLHYRVKLIPEDNQINMYLDLTRSLQRDMKQEEDNAKKDPNSAYNTFHSLITGNMSIQTGKLISNKIDNILYARYAYLVLPNGQVVIDTRYKNFQDSSRKYLGRKLSPSEYKNLSIGTLQQYQKKHFLILDTPVYKSSDNKLIGYLVIAFSLDILSDNLDTSLGNYGKVSLLNKEGIILNDKQKELPGTKINNNWFMDKIKNDIKSKNKIIKDTFFIIDKIKGEELYLAAIIPLSKINAPAKRIRKIIVLIFFIGMIIIFIVNYIVINWQFRPFYSLLEKIEKIKKGNLDVEFASDGNDEIGVLAKSLNKMLENINQLLNKVKLDQEEIRKLEFKALQQQINPHFLYNTLDFIYWMTRKRRYKEIQGMV